jgi:hypothetical protein
MLSSSFAPHVFGVLGACTEEEMIGADARRAVTVVEHAQVIGNGSVGPFPR